MRPASSSPAPRILYGTAWKEQRTAACVQRALQAGFRGIDTACQPKHYNEPGVGEGIAAFLSSPEAASCTRADLYVQTKFTSLSGQDPKRLPYDRGAPLPAQVTQSVEASLRNLRVDYLDCLVLHSPLSTKQATITVWRAMEEAHARGTARQLGISNCYDIAQLRELCQQAQVQPTVLQNRFYDRTRYDRELRALCHDRGIVYQSFWTLSANPHVLAHDVVTALSAKYGRTPAQVFFRYLTQESVVPLTGTQSLEHMREDLAIFDLQLSDAERASITTLLTI
jgi:diketogulonate reductase-like aldo/keto reductase